MRSPQCQMDQNNLARVFGPTVVGHGMSEPTPSTIMRDTNTQPKVLHQQIAHLKRTFFTERCQSICVCRRLCPACCPFQSPTGEVSSLIQSHPLPSPPGPATRMLDMVCFSQFYELFCWAAFGMCIWHFNRLSAASTLTGVHLLTYSFFFNVYFVFQVVCLNHWHLQSWTLTINPPARGICEAGSGTWVLPWPTRKITNRCSQWHPRCPCDLTSSIFILRGRVEPGKRFFTSPNWGLSHSCSLEYKWLNNELHFCFLQQEMKPQFGNL